MKKILFLMLLLLLSLFTSSWSCHGPGPQEQRMYVMNSDSELKSGEIGLHTGMHLPEHRVNDFYTTLKIIFENSLNFGDSFYSIIITCNDKENGYAYFSLRAGMFIPVIENSNFDATITNTTDKNYYMIHIETKEHEAKTSGKIYFRKLESDKASIAVMVEIKNDEGVYEYLTDLKFEGVQTHPHIGLEEPLPDFLK